MWPLTTRDELLFCHHVLKFICTKLSKCPVLGDVDPLAARELELGPTEGLNHKLLVPQLSADGHYNNLANVDRGECTPGLSKGATHTCLEPRLGRACQSWQSTGKSCIQGRSGQPAEAAGCTHCRGGCCSQPLHTGPPQGKSPVGLTGCKSVFF